MSKEQNEIIQFLQQNNFKADCPHCNDTFLLKEAVLFPLYAFPPEAKELLSQLKLGLKERKSELQALTAKTRQKTETTTHSVNLGFILERLAPVLPAFPFDKNDCRSLFDPIDYVIFEGLNKTGKVQKIFFVDIKSGAAKLKKNQKAIKQLVTDKKVEFRVY